MPVPLRALSRQGARDHIAARAASCHTPAVGLETEWFVVGPNRRLPIPIDVTRTAAEAGGPLPCGSRITYEPGGQLELSGPPAPTCPDAVAAMAADVDAVNARLATGGLRLLGCGVDTERPPVRMVDQPRYRAMEAYFAADGPAGRTMMCSTASVQVNVGFATDAETAAAFEVAQAVGPALVAAFANSTRMRTWWSMDRTRCRPLAGGLSSWPQYVLDARVMLIRQSQDDFQPVLPPLSFGDWIEQGHPAGFPTLDDLDYHLTTLFPPVRPRGWLEVRYLDALPDPAWRTAAEVVCALLTDGEAARKAVAGTEGLWADAVRCGLAHPALARAARRCFQIAGVAWP